MARNPVMAGIKGLPVDVLPGAEFIIADGSVTR